MLDVRQCRFEEVAASPRFADLCAEYSAESGMAGLPTPAPHADTYRLLEQSGKMKIIAAFEGCELVGFLVLLVYLNPHYSALLGVVESFFVAKAYRGSGAGMKLLRQAEATTTAAGAAGPLVSAPVGSLLAAVLDASKSYRETNRVFLREPA